MPAVQLQFLDDAGMWQDVTPHTNAEILSRIVNHHTTADDGHYRYSLQDMMQTNPRTGTRRKIRFYDASDVAPAWYFKVDSGTWEFSEILSACLAGRQHSGILEYALQNGVDVSRVVMHTSSDTYILTLDRPSLDLGEQVNLTTGRVRRIGMMPSTTIAAARQHAATHVSPPPLEGVLEASDDSDCDEEDDPLEEHPHDLCCPITNQLFRHPVIAADHKVYERSAIQRWFNVKSTSPLTGLPLASTIVKVHTATVIAVAQYRKNRHPASGEEASAS